LPGIREFTGELNEDNYREILRTFLEIDEDHGVINFRRFDMFRQRLIEIKECSIMDEGQTVAVLTVKGLSSGQPSLVAGDFVVLKDRLKGK
jgi:hypothetical protein